MRGLCRFYGGSTRGEGLGSARAHRVFKVLEFSSCKFGKVGD